MQWIFKLWSSLTGQVLLTRTFRCTFRQVQGQRLLTLVEWDIDQRATEELLEAGTFGMTTTTGTSTNSH